mgnify:CR=1 FL=1
MLRVDIRRGNRIGALLGVLCLMLLILASPVRAAVGDGRSQVEQVYGTAGLFQDRSGQFWTSEEWAAGRYGHARAYGYRTETGGLKATLWIEYDSQDKVAKETILLDENIKVRHFARHFPDLYNSITGPNSQAVVAASFPRNWLGVITGDGPHRRLITFFLAPEDKTAINMHSRIWGFALTAYRTGMTVMPPIDNYFRDEQYFSEPLSNRKRTDTIVIHHAAMPPATSRPDIHDLHLSNGWAGIGYHKVILADGTVEDGRPLSTVGAHALGANQRSVGIVLVGNFNLQPPPEVQLAAAVRVTQDLLRQYNLGPDKVLPHRGVTKGTVCPGLLFPWEDFARRIAVSARH